ncbi:KilA-N domain-containing protein [Methylomonas sp. HYX-M1]|uniref:KilA-N domain-containing protein n=1 Tax=Methylomonas sp. HYX-M1 TaxID=3139307 RepID=UPI00345B858F
MSTKYEIIEIDTVEITVDVSMLIKSDDMFFSATDLAKHFGKKPKDFLALESTKEYIDEIFKGEDSPLKKFDDLVRITKGKYGGTWLHNELAFEFAGWCSATFRRKLHKWTESRLAEEHQRRQHRLEARTGFLPMTNAIRAVHSELKPYHFSNECDMINRIVTGMTSKKFREVRGVESVRDALTAAQLQLLEKLQRQNTALIELGFGYEERKRMLQQGGGIADAIERQNAA